VTLSSSSAEEYIRQWSVGAVRASAVDSFSRRRRLHLQVDSIGIIVSSSHACRHIYLYCAGNTHTHGAGTCRISLLFSGRRRCVYHVRRGAGRRAEPVQVTTNLESDINKQASNSRFALHGWYNDSRRELGVFSRSVMITSAQQLHGCSAADVVAPPTPLHPPSSRIRIVL